MTDVRRSCRFGVLLGLLVLALAAASLPAVAASAPVNASPAATSITPPPLPAGQPTSLPPTRILDTRTTLGGRNGRPLGAGETASIRVVGVGGVPAAGVAAVSINLTAVTPTASGGLTVFRAGGTRPVAATVRFPAGSTTAEGATVQVGPQGDVAVFNLAGSTHVLVDVLGWISGGSGGSGGGVVAVAPFRILDTHRSQPLGPGQAVTVHVAGAGPVPPRGAAAALLAVTATSATTAGRLTVYPAGARRPATTSVALTAGRAVVNTALVRIGAGGSVTVFNEKGTVQVQIDVTAWVRAGAANEQGGVVAVGPARVAAAATRLPLSPGETRLLRVAGDGGVPAAGASAVVVNLTASGRGASNLTLYPSGPRRPLASTLNLGPGQRISNWALAPVGPDGGINVANSAGTTTITLDVMGYVASIPLTVRPPAVGTGSAALGTWDARRAAQILRAANRYAMGTWRHQVSPSLLGNALDYRSQVDSADPVRRLCMEAFSLAVALHTGAYDPSVAGASAATATALVADLVDRVAARHMSNTPAGWGASWQSSLWSSLCGRAAWLDWETLATRTRTRVARMVAFESDFVLGVPVHYLRDRSGKALTPGDTGSDDDSWFALPLQLAVVMLPTHPHARLWLRQETALMLDAWGRAADVHSAEQVNGAPMSAWLAGSNVEPDGSLLNHGRVAPDYSTLTYQNMDAVLLAALAGRAAPVAAVRLLRPVYAANTTVRYAAPPYSQPGGTVYPPSTARIYYPQGCDWGTGQEIPYALSDAQAASFLQAGSDASAYERLHSGKALEMQDRFTDGRTYGPETEYNYVGREEHAAQLAAQLYLTTFVRDRRLAAFTDASFWLPGTPPAPQPGLAPPLAPPIDERQYLRK